ncbi:MAG: NAD-dependent epimerase/dehydratase family protein [Parvularculaceae bacterium]
MKTIAVTGATGFLGRRLLNRARARGDRLRILLRRPAALARTPELEIVRGDLNDADALRRLIDGADAVVHLAGLTAARRRSEFFTVNAAGAERLARICRENHPNAYFLLISSLAARMPEISDYAESKRAGEAALAQSGLRNWSILRPPAVYGPGDRATLPFFQWAARGIAIAPASRSQFAMIYVDDLADAILASVDTRPPGRTYELRDAVEGYDWNTLNAALSAALGKPLLSLKLPRPLMFATAMTNEALAAAFGRAPMLSRGKVRELYGADWRVAYNELADATGWRPATDLKTGLERTLAWCNEAGLI